MRNNAFTLIEVLISIAIVGIISLFIVQFFTSMQKNAAQQRYTSEQTGIVQRVMGLIGDDIHRSDLLVPEGTVRPLDSGITGISIPQKVGSDATDTSVNRLDVVFPKPDTGSSCAASDGYEYHSYFTVLRSSLTGVTDTWATLPADGSNTGALVLMQYIGCLSTIGSSPALKSTRVFADYIGSFKVSYGTINDVNISIQATRTILGKTMKSPQDPASATYYSRRL